MKDIEDFAIKLFFVCLAIGIVFTTGRVYQHHHNEYKEPQQIVIDHYITDVQFDTMYLSRYDTLEYFYQDTIYEGGEIEIIEDTIQVPVPISKSIYSDTLKTDTTKFSYRMLVEGYNVAIDSVSYHFEYNPTTIQKKSQQRWFFGLAVGVTYYEGVKPCIGLGVGYRLF